MWTHFFTMVFPATNHWLGVGLVETGEAFSTIYISLSFLCIMYVPNFVFHFKQTKLGIQRFVFCFSNVKKRNKISQIYVF